MAHLGPDFAQLGPNLDPAWPDLAQLGPGLDQPSSNLDPTWPSFANLASTWRYIGPTGSQLDPTWAPTGPTRPKLATIQSQLGLTCSPSVPTWPRFGITFGANWALTWHCRHSSCSLLCNLNACTKNHVQFLCIFEGPCLNGWGADDSQYPAPPHGCSCDNCKFLSIPSHSANPQDLHPPGKLT